MGYIDRFNDDVKYQFIQAGIDEPEVVLTLSQIKDLNVNLTPKDKESFKKILQFHSNVLVDSAEFAFAWILNAQPVGHLLGKSDLILNGQNISVKSWKKTPKRKNYSICFGRMSSNPSYKELMSLWSFYVSFLGGKEKGMKPTRMTKNQVQNVKLDIEPISRFLNVSLRSVPILYTSKENTEIKNFVEKLIEYSKMDNKIIDLIKSSMQETIHNYVNHIILIDKETLEVKLALDVDIDDKIFEKYFHHLAGDQIFINL